MSTGYDVIQRFTASVCGRVELVPEGDRRFRVLTPFSFDDGDYISLLLALRQDRWELTDEGSTYMRLSYWLDETALSTDSRRRVIENALAAGNVQEEEGQLRVPVEQERFGDAYYTLVQAVLRMADVSLLTREQVRSTFAEDLRSLIDRTIPERFVSRNWHDPQHDRKGRYPVDYRLATEGRDSQIFVFGLQTEDRVKDATITLHQFEKWHLRFHTVGVFQEMEAVSAKAYARFADVAGKNFSSLQGNENRILKHLRNMGVPIEPSALAGAVEGAGE